ncbi:MAG: hypothetical protein WDA07_10775 [Leucobacter sp.]
MNRTLKVTKLHLNKWENFIGTPVIILAVVMAITLIIQIAIQRATGISGTDPEYIEGARWNQAIMWALPGFLVYYGVQAVATTYPFALALGTTRRNFIGGTMISNALQAIFITVLLVALLGIELATGHWFIGLYVLDVHLLGAGNVGVLAATSFLGVMFCLTVGGLFGAVWVRFGSMGPAFLGLGAGLALALTLLILAPRLGEIFTGLTGGAVAVAAIVVIVVALAGTWFAMRRASVR